jgi:hypothetical protein
VIEMFKNEARLVSRLSHPNVAQVLEFDRADGLYFLALEYVFGESLATLLAWAQPSRAYAARIVADAAAGLHAAHELRDEEGMPLEVVHRDVSPQNILVGYDGVVKVTDFGIARARGQLGTTGAGEIKGKFAYLAPEQAEPGSEVDRRADLFALGVVLFEATTGRSLFRGENDAETLNRVLRCEVPRPTASSPDYPPELERVVLRALERDPDRRFATAQEMQQALESFIKRASDSPLLTAQVGELMSRVFADRMRRKQALLANPAAAPDGGVPEVYLFGSAVRPAKRRARALGLVAAVAVLAAVLGWWGLRPAPPVETPAPPAVEVPPVRSIERRAADRPPRQPHWVTLSISAEPAQAEIVIAGVAMGNPVRVKRAASDSRVPVVVSAPGFLSERFEADLARDGRWQIALRPAVAKPPQRAVRRRHLRAVAPSRRKKRAKKPEEEYFANPYGERR